MISTEFNWSSWRSNCIAVEWMNEWGAGDEKTSLFWFFMRFIYFYLCVCVCVVPVFATKKHYDAGRHMKKIFNFWLNGIATQPKPNVAIQRIVIHCMFFDRRIQDQWSYILGGVGLSQSIGFCVLCFVWMCKRNIPFPSWIVAHTRVQSSKIISFMRFLQMNNKMQRFWFMNEFDLFQSDWIFPTRKYDDKSQDWITFIFGWHYQ